ncbi:anti-sigma factor [Paraburkholderia sp. CNPSo 3157]|uniref:Anti-sigma factor n=1 Tax=Paraburkholderia franconis TaxID=2654983 RepID=A0A7X1THY8_9BURK|nr:anti-sigma factor [Paraburkholderia franconis]MPW19664.1 anti-sigma factor [Paraburkholderia franconis]
MKNIDDSMLMMYVDGELPPEQRAEVAAAIAHSHDLGARVDALRASCLPYRAAFERQRLPPVPESLVRRVDELVSVSAPRQRGDVPRKAPAVPWLAAAFVAGAVISGVLTGYLGPLTPFHHEAVSPWVRSVADYQVLYGRETVASIRDDPANTEQILTDIRQRDGMPVRVPDLQQAGLKFKRVQRLNYDNRPLIQIVYLPERGDPVALCVLEVADSLPDEPVRAQQVGQMKTVTWRSNKLAYVLLAKNTPVDLQQMAQKIANGKVSYLYGDA